MTTQDNLSSVLQPEELAALQQGTNIFRTALTQEMGVLLTNLGLGDEMLSAALDRTAEEARSMTMLDAKDAAEHARALRIAFVGRTSVAFTQPLVEAVLTLNEDKDIDTSASDDQHTETDDFPVEDTSEEPIIEDPTPIVEEQIADVEIAVPKVYITDPQLKKFIMLFGEENGALLNSLELDKVDTLIDKVLDHLVTEHVFWSTQKALRKNQWHERIVDGKIWREFGDAKASAQIAFSRAGLYIRNKMSAEDRRQLLLQVIDENASAIEDVQLVAPIHTAEASELFHIPETITNLHLKKARVIVKGILGNSAHSVDTYTLTYEECIQHIHTAFTAVSEQSIMRRKSDTSHIRKQIIEAVLYTDKNLAQISEELGKSRTFASNYLQSFFDEAQQIAQSGNTVQQRLDNRDNQSSSLQPESGLVGVSVSTVVEEATPPQAVESVSLMKDEAEAETDPLEAIAKTLQYSDAVRFRTLRTIFDSDRAQPDYSIVARGIYDDVENILEEITANKKYELFIGTLEYRAVNMIVRGATNGDPLGPLSVQRALARDLQIARRKFKDVIADGLRQLAAIQTENMRIQAN